MSMNPAQRPPLAMAVGSARTVAHPWGGAAVIVARGEFQLEPAEATDGTH